MGDSDTWCRYWGMAIGIIGRRHTTCHIDGTYLLIETKVSSWQDVWIKKWYVLEKKIFNWLLTPSYHVKHFFQERHHKWCSSKHHWTQLDLQMKLILMKFPFTHSSALLLMVIIYMLIPHPSNCVARK